MFVVSSLQPVKSAAPARRARGVLMYFMGMSYLIIGFAQILKLSVAFVSDLGHTNDCVVTCLLIFCVINAINASFSTAEGYIQTVK